MGNPVWILWLPCLLIAGCYTGKSADHDGGASADLWYSDRGVRVHASLFCDGAAKVEFSPVSAHEPIGNVRTVLLPAHPKEVSRLVAAMNALHDASATDPLWDSRGNRDEITINFGVRGREHRLSAREDQVSRNRLFGGLVAEFKQVAQVDLARALYDHDVADVYLASGRIDRASVSLDSAAHEFSEWENSFRSRHCDGIWEPGIVGKEFAVDDQQMTIAGGPVGPSLLASRAELSVEKSVELAKRCWVWYVGFDLSLSESDATVIVTYAPAFMRGCVSGISPTVPASVTAGRSTSRRGGGFTPQ